MKKKYLALTRLASADGSEVWNVGALIELDDDVAQKHLANKAIEPYRDTKPPAAPKPLVKVHESKDTEGGK